MLLGVLIPLIGGSAASCLNLLSPSFPGDEILGASINFEHLSKEEVLQVLKVMEPFNDKVHVFTRNNRSKSLGHLDQCVGPETVGGAGSEQTQVLLPPSLIPVTVFRC